MTLEQELAVLTRKVAGQESLTRQALDLAAKHARRHIDEGADPFTQDQSVGHTHTHSGTTGQGTGDHHTQVHGISVHTEHANWKALYTDGSGDEQELALGADGTFLQSGGASTVPEFTALVDGDIPSTHAGSAHHGESHTLASHSAKAHADLSDAPTSAHHTKYTDASAISAVEGEATLVLSGAVTITGLGFAAATELTISSGSVARTQTVHVIDTENDDAADTLTNVTGGAAEDLLIFSTINNSRDVTIAHAGGGAGQFSLADSTSAVLDSNLKMMLFKRSTTDLWVEVSRNFSTSASATVEGVVELATTAEINTGTDSTRAMPVDQYVASLRNVHWVQIRLVASGTDVATGTTIEGDWVCPFTGTLLQDDNHKELLMAYNDTAGTTGTMVVDIHKGGTTIMTTNKLDIETGEKNTRDATTQPDLTTTAVTKGDIFTFDVDAVHSGTAAKGLVVAFAIRLT